MRVRLISKIGLFSIKTRICSCPVLDYVPKVSSAAGASFVGAIKPFLLLITEGMDLMQASARIPQSKWALDIDIAIQAGGMQAIIPGREGLA